MTAPLPTAPLQTHLRELQPGLTPFPAATNVFVPEQSWLADHLLPLISIDLRILRPELAGTVVHMLCPVEPFEGYIGDGTEPYHNDYTAPNWFALQLTQDNRYRFLGNEGYFQRSPVHAGKFTQDPGDQKYAAQMIESYAKARAYFDAHGRLASYSRYGDGEAREQDYLDSLGGEFEPGNWAMDPSIPKAYTFEHDQHYHHVAIRYKDKPFFPVAAVAGYRWCAAGADSILLFYEPASRTALFTFDWT